ncbi:hypothetical protein [Cohaesibacter marisflavi]|uniref:hypothetical protein n=1 Tax=Cohaesibacter marisflavi TaxID=655353 RepID=UPI0029C8B9F2|nr:hypothetical protein [Cohaesibacter marisflavi]
MKSALMMAVLMACLSGCATRGSSLSASSDASGTDWANWPVPILKTYDKRFVGRLIGELQATSPDSALRVCVADLKLLRQQICAINDGQTACQLMRQEK